MRVRRQAGPSGAEDAASPPSQPDQASSRRGELGEQPEEESGPKRPPFHIGWDSEPEDGRSSPLSGHFSLKPIIVERAQTEFGLEPEPPLGKQRSVFRDL